MQLRPERISILKLTSNEPRTLTAEFNGERVAGLSWPATQNHVSVRELTY